MNVRDWHRLDTPEEFAAYQTAVLEVYRLKDAKVKWETTPRQYPCLAASVVFGAGMSQVVTAFVYVSDAKRLLTGTAVPAKAVAAPSAEVSALPTQAQFNRWSSALLTTLIELVIGVGISTEEKFEETLLAKLKLVDQFRDADLARFREAYGNAQAMALQRLGHSQP